MVNHPYLIYLVKHVEVIIEWLFISILAISLYLSIRWLFGKKSDSAVASDSQINQLEATLKKLLAQTENNLKKVAEAQVVVENGEGGVNGAEADALKKNLQEKEKQISILKKELEALKAAPKDQASSGQVKDLQARLSELEGKLKEYEIIEDDIADLSLYKEENARLKEQLAQIQAGGSVVPPPPPVAEVQKAAPQPMPPAKEIAQVPVDAQPFTPQKKEYVDDSIMKEFAAAVSNKVIPEPPQVAEVKAPAVATGPEDSQGAIDNILEEFSQAVDEQKSQEASQAKPTVEDQPVVNKEAAIDNILAEFSQAVNEQKAQEVIKPTPPPPPSAKPEVAEDIMSEFAAAVAEQKAQTPTMKRTPPPPPITSVIAESPVTEEELVEGVTDDIMAEYTFTPAEEGVKVDHIDEMAKVQGVATAERDRQDSVDDIMEAFAQDIPKKTASSKPEVLQSFEEGGSDPLSGELNMDKMLEEVVDLDKVAPVDDNSLDEQLDTDKLLSEASKLEG